MTYAIHQRDAELKGKLDGIAIGEKRGEKRGLALGEKRGLALGEKRGLAKGRQMQEETARKLLLSGMSVQDVCNFTSLTAAEVKALRT